MSGHHAVAATALAGAGAAGAGRADDLGPGLPGSASSARPAAEYPDEHHRLRTSLLAGAAALLLLGSGTAATIALTAGHGHRPASHLSEPSVFAEPGTSAATTAPHQHHTGHHVPGPSPVASGATPIPNVSRAASASSTARSSSTSPGKPKPSSPPPAGQALYAGTWSGMVSQPRWPVSSWTIQLNIPASGSSGSYTSPSQGCTGYLVLSSPSDGTMYATAVATGPVGGGTGCTKNANLALTLFGGGQMDLTYTPTQFPNVPGSATLTKA